MSLEQKLESGVGGALVLLSPSDCPPSPALLLPAAPQLLHPIWRLLCLLLKRVGFNNLSKDLLHPTHLPGEPPQLPASAPSPDDRVE